SAECPEMPNAAAILGPARFVLSPREMGPVVHQLLRDSQARLPANDETLTDDSPQNAMSATRVLLVDDHRIVLDGLRALLSDERDFEVLVKDAENGCEAVRLSAELAPNVVVMDLAMPELDGIAATQHILAENPRTKVIALTAHTDEQIADRALR